ncbi:hypothetical protein HMPREF0083_04222 [Aneurinibacillus aneurinilyticus ATCC 12856]|jgi:hypothetical protein|uniref:Uncharacterized protein n=1 Tax=Aneurinibacillus aneurinilyticus ATCC 12856 TaxID=649747 RepID=U1Y6A1_ANEAE|nr:hypothetical protein HMPREF0083_04222 [Aneurinibacillus aneurinilyticus ATCC 12856]
MNVCASFLWISKVDVAVKEENSIYFLSSGSLEKFAWHQPSSLSLWSV